MRIGACAKIESAGRGRLGSRKRGFAGGGWTGIATITYEPLDDAVMMYIWKVTGPLRDRPTDKGRTPQ